MDQDTSARIQIRVGDVRQLFNSIDPSPFRDRDLDPECEKFIVSWARELPVDQPLSIEILLERETMTDAIREQLPAAVRGHFRREADMEDLRFRRLLREGRTSLIIGLVFLAICTTAATLAPSAGLGPFANLLAESLIIAGWVAMWHPLQILLYGLWPVRRERRLLERLASAEIVTAGSPASSAAAADKRVV